MRKQIIAIVVAAVLVPSLALASDGDRDSRHNRDGDRSHKSSQINFDGPVELTPLASLQTFSFGDQDVIVEGKIVRQLANGDYTFTDGKDEITVEMKRVILDQAINDQTTLRLFGEYEGWDKTLEVEQVKVMGSN